MKVQIIQHTGKTETVTEKVKEGEETKDVKKEKEILETVQEVEFDESQKASMATRAQLRAIMLSRDTGKKHVVKMV
jgi:hypothetical protein